METKKEIAYGLMPVFWLVLFMLMAGVHAYPMISGLAASPANPWLGEDVSITLDCTDDPNASITAVNANISGPSMTFSNIELDLLYNNTYGTDMMGNDLTETGLYNINVACQNNASETASKSGSFAVSRLDGLVTSVLDVENPVEEGVAYGGEDFYAYFMVKRDDSPVTADVDFQVRLNNEDKTIQQPIPWVQGGGHRLRMDAPSAEGDYMLEIWATYQGRQTYNETWIEVREPLKFELLDIDKSSISNVEEIMIRLRATDHGNAVAMREEDLSISINDVQADINSITQDGDAYNVEITPPNLAPGSYDLEIEFDYNGYNKILEREFSYSIPVSGEISHNGKGITLEIQFTDENGVLTTLRTDGTGKYSGTLSPGDYDIALKHSESRLTLYDVEVMDEFEDPIRYYYEADKTIPGIKTASLFFYETALTYSEASMEMYYDEKKVESPEKDLRVYKCTDWNGEECYSEWGEVESTIDTVRNLARVNTEGLSAYVVGVRGGMSTIVGLDKDAYNLYETLKADGIVTTEDNTPIPDASVTVRIKGTSKTKTATTGGDGVFDVEFTVPDSEGEYTVEVTIEKLPFSQVKATKTFEVVKSRGLLITSQSGVKMDAIGNKTIGFSVKNTGQAVLHDLEVSIDGIPDGIFAVLDKEVLDEMGPQDEVSFSLGFGSTTNKTATHPLVIQVASEEGISAERTFVLTTEKRSAAASGSNSANSNQNSTTVAFLDFSMIGNIIGGISSGVGYLLVVLVGSFSFALVMRKRRMSKTTERGWVKNMLSGVNQEINRPEQPTKSRKGRKKKQKPQKSPGNKKKVQIKNKNTKRNTNVKKRRKAGR